MGDIAESLIFEVKKDIADRYFGFRKIIEEDSAAYYEEVSNASDFLETQVAFDLLRIYTLLRDNTLITRFCKFINLDAPLFFDSYVNNSPAIRKRLLAGQKTRGFFRKQRFANLFYDTYHSLLNSIEKYRAMVQSLMEEHEVIKEEIKLFYRKNDISGIMCFLRGLDGDSSTNGPMSGSIDSGGSISMEDKMRLHAPQAVTELLPVLKAIPTLAEIKPDLKVLIETAYTQQNTFDVKNPS